MKKSLYVNGEDGRKSGPTTSSTNWTPGAESMEKKGYSVLEKTACNSYCVLVVNDRTNQDGRSIECSIISMENVMSRDGNVMSCDGTM